jgi:ribose transport system substrate-binding protein
MRKEETGNVMKHKHNKLLILITAVLLSFAVLFGFLAYQPPAEAQEYTISVILHDSDNPRWQNLRTGMRAAAREYNVRLNIIQSTPEDDAETILENIQQALDNGTDGVVTDLSDSEQEAEFLALVKPAQPFIFIENTPSDSPAGSASISYDAGAAMDILTNQVRVNAAGRPVVLGVVNQNSDDRQNRLALAMLEKEADNYGWTIRWQKEGSQVSADTLKQTMQDDPVSVLICLDNASSETAIDASFEEDVSVLGFGSSRKCIYAADTGTLQGLIVPDFYLMGYRSIEEIFRKITERTLLEDLDAGFRLINQYNLHTRDNEQLLFPIS